VLRFIYPPYFFILSFGILVPKKSPGVNGEMTSLEPGVISGGNSRKRISYNAPAGLYFLTHPGGMLHKSAASTDKKTLSVAPKKQSPERALYEICDSRFHQRNTLQYFFWISRTLVTAPTLLGGFPRTRSMFLGSTRDSPQSSCMTLRPHSLIPRRL
jgi:hypothetical protein